MALDLSFAQGMVESLMEDAATISDYGDGLADRVFDTVAGSWVAATPVSVVVHPVFGWTEQSALANDEQVEGEADAARVRFTGKVPLGAPAPAPGQIVEITTCGRDPQSVGRRFRITKMVGGTFKLARRFTMVEVQATLGQPADRDAT